MIELTLNNDIFEAGTTEVALSLLRSKYGQGVLIVLPDLKQWDQMVMPSSGRVAIDPFTHQPALPTYQAQHSRYGFCGQCRSEMWKNASIYAPGDPEIYFLRPIDSIEYERAKPARLYWAQLVACATPFVDEYDRRWNRDHDDRRLTYQCGHAPEDHDESGCTKVAWLAAEYRVECPCERYTRPAPLARITTSFHRSSR